jgi:hypothetical protein
MPIQITWRWRTVALVAAGVAGLELVGLVLAGSALLARSSAHAAAIPAKRPHRAASKRHRTTAAPLLARARTAVLILNGGGRAGAAAAEAQLARAHGYPISRVGNAPTRGYGRSVVMYRARFRREGLRLARDLRIGLVGPLDGVRPRLLGRARVVVILGN